MTNPLKFQALNPNTKPAMRPAMKLVRRGPSPLVLEQRFMFDGAAMADAAYTLDVNTVLKTLVDRTVSTAPSALVTAHAEAQRLVTAYLAQPDARAQLFALFNGGQSTATPEWQAAFDQLMTSLTSGDGAVTVELRTSAELQGAKGAFTSMGTDGKATIYLNADWLAGNPSAGIGAADSASITAVLVEELGHSFDARLNNGADTPGDEGEHFSRVLLAGINPSALDVTSLQDDRGVLQLDGQAVNVEFATFSFVNAYKMVYDLNLNGVIDGNLGESDAAKEQSRSNFNPANLGTVRINDDTGSQSFSGNDVSAIGLNISGTDYYGWISRPIKSNGIVRGFYFWTDVNFTNLATAQADGNSDADGNTADNRGFVLVVDQAWFTANVVNVASLQSLPAAVGPATRDIDNTFLPSQYATVGSSSDRVDSALNSLLPSNVAPVAVADTSFTAGATPAVEAGGAVSNLTGSVAATGNVLTNDTDANLPGGANPVAGETKTLTAVGTSAANQLVAAASTSGTSPTLVTGTYGTLSIGADGSYSYNITDNTSAAMQALRTTSDTLTETFTYKMVDRAGLASTTTLTVTIRGQNDAPIAVNDFNTAKESILTDVATGPAQYDPADPLGSLATGNVLDNDTDVDRNSETKTIVGMSITGTATGATSAAGTTVTTLTFATLPSTARIGFFAFDDSDNTGNGAPGTLTILKNAAGVNLTIASIDTVAKTVTLSGLVNLGVTGGGADLAAAAFTRKINGTNQYSDGVVTVNGTTFTTNVNLTGATGTVAPGMTVTYSGSSGTITVIGVTYNASGVATAMTLNQSGLNLSGLALTFSGSASAGSTITGQYGVLALNADGSYIYTPTPNNPAVGAGQTVVDNFNYSMQDAAGATSAAVLSITVLGSGSNDPNANADTNTATEQGGVGNATAGVNPTGNVITGVITLNSGGAVGVADSSPSGPNYVIAARAGASASDTAIGTVTTTGTIASGAGRSTLTVVSATGITVGMGVAGTNIASGTTVSAISGTTITLSIQAAAATSGTGFLFVTPTTSIVLNGLYGDLTLQANGSYTYAVNNTNATVQALRLVTDTLTDTFTYTISNGQLSSGATGTLLKDSTTLTLTIRGANDTPVAVADTAAVSEDNVLTASGSVLTDDTDVDGGDTKVVSRAGTTTANTVVDPGTTSATGLSISGTYGTLVLGADGTYTYTLATAADATRWAALQALTVGPAATEVFRYEVRDTSGATSITTLTVSVTGANELPVNRFNGTEISSTATTSVTTTMNTAVVFTGTNALSIADADSNLASITLNVDNGLLSFTSAPAIVTLSASSSSTITISAGTQAQLNAALALLRYTPTTGFTGTDFLTISSVDSLGGRDSDGIAIYIPTVFTGPTVLESHLASGSNPAGTGESATTTLAFPTGQTFGTTNQSGTDTFGTWTLNATTRIFTYNLTSAPPVSGASSTRSIDVITYDTTGNALTNKVTVTITDDAPTANADSRSVTEGSLAAPAANISGNVFASGVTGDVADVMGADSSSNPVINVIAGSATPTTAVAAGSTSATSGTVVTGLYGTLTIGANGSYIYDLDDANPTVDALNNGSSLSEVFTYQIVDADGDVSNATLTITINGLSDTVGGTPTVSVNNVTVNEGSPYAVFTVSLSNTFTSAISFTPSLVTGTATVGTDIGATLQYYNGSSWVSTSGGITIAVGATSVLVRTTITNDGLYEGSEAFTLSTGAITGTVTNAGGATGTGTIVDDGTGSLYPDNNTGATGSGTLDDDRPVFSVGAVTVSEGGLATFTVTRTGVSAVSQTVDVSSLTLASPDTAQAGDFTALGTTTLTFAAGVDTQTFTVQTTQDTSFEGAETFRVQLANATGGALLSSTAATATGTIVDDGRDIGGTPANDDRPSFAINDVTINEAAGTATFTVTKTGTTALSSTVAFAFTDGTATAGAGNDYTATAGTLTFAAGVSTQTITVNILNDSPAVFEGAESFNVNLSSATNATISDNLGVGTIMDDGTGTGGTDDDSPVAIAPPAVAPSTPVPQPPPPVSKSPPPDPQPSISVPTEVPLAPLPPFNSATLMQVHTSQPRLESGLSPVGRQLTSDVAFPVVVADPGDFSLPASLTVLNGITDQFVAASRLTRFALPYDAFVHTKPDATITLVAKQADGTPLPDWVQFDAQSGTFTVNPPAAFNDELKLIVVARDQEGREATASFRFFVGEEKDKDKVKPKQSNRLGLTEQLQLAGKRQAPWTDLTRQQPDKPLAREPAAVRVAAVV